MACYQKGSMEICKLPYSLKDGDIILKKVKAYVYRNQLYMVVYQVEGLEQSETYLMYLKMRYGEGKQKGYAPHYEWENEQIRLVYDRNLFSGNTEVRWEYLPIIRHLEKQYRNAYGF